MRRLRLLVTALILAFTWQAHALSISIDANLLKDANGNPMPTTGLVILVASTNDSTFNAPTPLNFVSGDDVIIGKWDLSAFGQPGVLSDFVNTTVLVSASNPLQLYWFPTLTLSSTAPGQGTPYGTYRNDSAVDGSDPWFGSSPAATIALKFLTQDADTDFDNASTINPPDAAKASTVTPTAIAVLSQPQSVIKKLGDSANFSVVASGTGLAYQWLKNGANLADAGNIAGSTSSILTVTSISPSDAATYSVVITNSQAVVTSSNATLTVDDLAITAQPASFTAGCGEVWPCLSVTASASTGVTYQWYTPDANGTAIANATNATLCLNNSFTSAGNYAVVVTSGYGNAIASSVATVTVTDTTGPAIALNGVSPQTVCQNSPYTEAGATAVDSCDGSVIVTPSGSVDSSTVGSYTITYTASDSHGNTSTATRVVNVNDCTVATDPTITTQPLAQVVINGKKNIQLSVVATGTGTLKYQWFKEGIGAIAHKTNSVMNFVPTVTTANSGTYYCVVSGLTNVESSHVGLSVDYAPVAAITPPKLTKTAGATAQFKVTATPANAVDPSRNLGGPVTFHWLKNGSPLSAGDNIGIADTMNTSVLTIMDVQISDQAVYQCIVSNLATNVTTANTKGILTVNPDVKTPVANILHPTPNLRFTNGVAASVGGGVIQTNFAPELDIDGKAADNGFVTNVALVRIIPPGSLSNNVVLTYRTNKAGLMLPGSLYWTNHVTLLPGTNTFMALANDSAGNANINNSTRTYYFFTNCTVIINVNTNTFGTVNGAATLGIKPVIGANQLPIGIGFKLTAVPKTGKHIKNWTDGNGTEIQGNSTTYFFTATNGVIIKANFQ